jgi:hypothetical protein
MAAPPSDPLTCPLCHTPHPTGMADAPRIGSDWVCTRCGQTWSAARIETVAAYVRYTDERSA